MNDLSEPDNIKTLIRKFVTDIVQSNQVEFSLRVLRKLTFTALNLNNRNDLTNFKENFKNVINMLVQENVIAIGDESENKMQSRKRNIGNESNDNETTNKKQTINSFSSQTIIEPSSIQVKLEMQQREIQELKIQITNLFSKTGKYVIYDNSNDINFKFVNRSDSDI